MKRLFALCLVAIALTGCAGQNTGPKMFGAQATVLTGDPNNKTSLDTNFGNIQSNFTELYGWLDQGVKTTSDPSFLSVHASGGNLAASNAQVTKKWITGLPYVADVTSVIHGGKHYICTSTHTAGSTTEPGIGESYETVWKEETGGVIGDITIFDQDAEPDGVCTDGNLWIETDGTTGERLYSCEEGTWVKLSGGGAAADDTAYNATSWDANTDAATKNAIRDKIEALTLDAGLPSGTVDQQILEWDSGTSAWVPITPVDITADGKTIAIAAGEVSAIGSGTTTATKSADYTLGTDSDAESYGGTIYVTAAATITAEAVATKMNFTIVTIGNVAVSLDVNASDRMYLDGVALADGDKATNTSTTGDTITCAYESAAGWYCWSGSVDGDHWTDGN